jgi:predicted metalloprotease
MRLDDQRESGNVEDRRGRSFGPGAGIGCGGLLLVLVISLLTGRDPAQLLQLLQGVQEQQEPAAPAPGGPGAPPADQLGTFASKVLGSTEDVWGKVFRQAGKQYQDPRLVLFSGSTPSACGFGSAATGPFYCPADNRVYIDLSFFNEMTRKLGAPGDFAQAYVIAHEVGHHVQTLLGISDQVTAAQRRARSEGEANQFSVGLELQADCFAGVWAHHAQKDANLLEPGDVEEGLNAAAAIGDDRLQQMGQGYVQPESFTHGSSAQRVQWLRKGIESGDPNACKTL